MKTKHWIMVFVGLALVLLAILLLRPKQSGLVGIYRDGRLIETVDLTKDRTIPLDGAAGGATAAVQDGEIYMESAECPDQICVEHGPLRPGGTPIVCLPNRLSIQWIERDAAVDAVSGGRERHAERCQKADALRGADRGGARHIRH